MWVRHKKYSEIVKLYENRGLDPAGIDLNTTEKEVLGKKIFVWKIPL